MTLLITFSGSSSASLSSWETNCTSWTIRIQLTLAMQVVMKCSGTLRNYRYHLRAPFIGAIYRCYLRVPFAGTIYVCHLQAPLRAPFTVAIYGYHLQVQAMGAIYERHLGAIYGCLANRAVNGARAGAPMAPSCAKLRLTYDIEVFLIATYFDQIYL